MTDYRGIALSDGAKHEMYREAASAFSLSFDDVSVWCRVDVTP